MAITEYNYIPKYIKRTIANKPKDVVTASYWNELFNLLIAQGDHTAEELGNVLNHFTTVITGVSSETADAIAGEHEYASAFEIHLNTNTNPITADKSFAEIRQAIIDKREILLWVSEVQCLKPTCKAFEHTITLVVFDYSPAGPVVRADVYECYDEDEWFIKQNIELAKQNDIGDIRDLTTTHKYNLVAAVNDKQDKSTLEADVTAKGFTKNTGTYSKPANGIPKADLASAVQTSLGKADTALQEHQSLAAYRTAEAQDLIDNSKQDKLIAGENITIAADGKTISATGGGASAFKINLLTNIDPITADKSFADIRQAIVDGRDILLHVDAKNSAKPVCNVYDDFIALTVFAYDFYDHVMYADYYECSNTNEWYINESRKLADYADIGDLRDLTTYRSNLVAAINDKQDKLIAGENITIAADGKTISAIGGSSASIAMRVNSGYIQYSTDNGATWSNLIAEADLKGDKGDKGDTGATGPQGIQGVQGPQGERGPAGADGSIGPQGPKGDKGDTGSQGPQGVKGDKGDKGVTGPQGPKGDKGDSGADGATGPQGPQGLKGDIGPQGPKGDAFTYSDFTAEQLAALKGEKGDTGPQGPQGPKGDKGDTGSAGAAGSDGQSAYAAAQAGGYTDTQANFYTDLAAMQGLASALAAI